jgi:hypothetical protein
LLKVLFLSNVFEHIEDKWFVPDAQVIFPVVFLSDVEPLTGISVMYKDCFKIVSESCNYLVLPSNVTDFSGLVLNKLREFLGQIESIIRKARDEKWSEQVFYSRTQGQLRSINNFGRALGDLLAYWSAKKGLFWSYVSIDPALVRKKMMSLIIDKLGIYTSICEDHEVDYTLQETAHSDSYFVLIRDAQRAKKINSSANDADLMILADCLVYTTERLPQGLLYLVTNDNELFGATASVVNNPNSIISTIATGTRLAGLEPLRPKKLVDDFRSKR